MRRKYGTLVHFHCALLSKKVRTGFLYAFTFYATLYLNLIDVLLKQVNLVGGGTVSVSSLFFLGTALQI